MSEQCDDETDQGTLVRVHHSDIGREGCIVELRPGEHDFPSERDMTHLSREEAETLRDALDEYVNTEIVNEEIQRMESEA